MRVLLVACATALALIAVGSATSVASGAADAGVGPGDWALLGPGCDLRGATGPTGCHTWASRYSRNRSPQVGTFTHLGPKGERVYLGGATGGFIPDDGADTLLVAHDAQTGEVLWDWSARGAGGADEADYLWDVTTSPDGALVYATGLIRNRWEIPAARTWAFDAETGNLLWTRTRQGSDPQSYPGVSGEAMGWTPGNRSLLLVSSVPAHLQALNPATGDQRWNVTDLAPIREACRGCLEVVEERGIAVLQGDNDGSDTSVAVVNVTNRSVRWSTNKGGTPGARYSFDGDVEVGVKKGLVYSMSTHGVFDRSGRITARELQTGDVAWTTEFPGLLNSIHVSDDGDTIVITGAQKVSTAVFFPNWNAWVAGIDASNGSVLWTQRHDDIARQPFDIDLAMQGFTVPGNPLSVVGAMVDSGVDGDRDSLFFTFDEATGEVVKTVRFSQPVTQDEALRSRRVLDFGEGTGAVFAGLESLREDRSSDTLMVRYELNRFVPDENRTCVAESCVPETGARGPRDSEHAARDSGPEQASSGAGLAGVLRPGFVEGGGRLSTAMRASAGDGVVVWGQGCEEPRSVPKGSCCDAFLVGPERCEAVRGSVSVLVSP